MTWVGSRPNQKLLSPPHTTIEITPASFSSVHLVNVRSQSWEWKLGAQCQSAYGYSQPCTWSISMHEKEGALHKVTLRSETPWIAEWLVSWGYSQLERVSVKCLKRYKSIINLHFPEEKWYRAIFSYFFRAISLYSLRIFLFISPPEPTMDG